MANNFVSVRVEGLSPIIRDLIEFGVALDDIKQPFSDLAAQGARIAESAAPMRTGRLRGNIRGNRARNKAVVSAGGASVPYAGPINYGWPKHNITASGFMQAVDAQLGTKAPQIIQKGLNDLIRRYGLG